VTFKFEKGEETHGAKFEVWKRSMAFRYTLEFLTTLFLTLFFQVYITRFN